MSTMGLTDEAPARTIINDHKFSKDYAVTPCDELQSRFELAPEIKGRLVVVSW